MRGVRSFVDPAACAWGVLRALYVDFVGLSESTKPAASRKAKNVAGSSPGGQPSLKE